MQAPHSWYYISVARGDKETTKEGTIMARWGYTAHRWNATIEEKNTAATLRKDVLAAINDSNMSKDVREWAEWMICRVSNEALERKVRRMNAEEWFKDAITTLKRGDTFTQSGLLETFDAPDDVRNYATFILSEWSYNGYLIQVNNMAGNSLMRGSLNCNTYEVL